MRSKRDFLLIGVTGGIGCGKSFVCSLFERLGRRVLKADEVAQKITDSDPVVRKQIVQLLGPSAYGPDGPLDRAFVAGKVFADHDLLWQLNGIVHPPVILQIEKCANGLPEAQRKPYVLVEAALIYESGMDAMLDKVIVVEAAEEIRIRRVMERDTVSREAVLQRIAAQLPADAKSARADFIIRNEENTVPLEDKVRFLDTIMSALAPA